MLFINDDQSQILKLHIIFNQSMCTNQKMNFSILQFWSNFSFQKALFFNSPTEIPAWDKILVCAVWKCCSAKISVGVIMHNLIPAFTVCNADKKATIVFRCRHPWTKWCIDDLFSRSFEFVENSASVPPRKWQTIQKNPFTGWGWAFTEIRFFFLIRFSLPLKPFLTKNSSKLNVDVPEICFQKQFSGSIDGVCISFNAWKREHSFLNPSKLWERFQQRTVSSFSTEKKIVGSTLWIRLEEYLPALDRWESIDPDHHLKVQYL